jgi:RimJ/RimL family protein N-acetyltransferase
MPPPAIPEGRTPRLLLRPFALEDAPQIQRLFPQWEIVKYLNAKIPWPYPPDGAEQFLRDSAIPQMAAGDAWHWTLRLLTNPDSIIGAISLVAGEDENRGFWLHPAHRGHGLMTEACIWVNDYWFDTLGRPLLRAPKAIANQGSRRISQRMGMRILRAEDRDFISGRLPSEIWEITAEEWHAWKRLHPGAIAPKPKSARASRKSPSALKKRRSPVPRTL